MFGALPGGMPGIPPLPALSFADPGLLRHLYNIPNSSMASVDMKFFNCSPCADNGRKHPAANWQQQVALAHALHRMNHATGPVMPLLLAKLGAMSNPFGCFLNPGDVTNPTRAFFNPVVLPSLLRQQSSPNTTNETASFVRGGNLPAYHSHKLPRARVAPNIQSISYSS